MKRKIALLSRRGRTDKSACKHLRTRTLLFVVFCSVAALGQKSISGKVQDAQGEPIAYATVSLLRADSTVITGAITDEKGAFSLSANGPTPTLPTREGVKSNNNYILQVSFIGYKTETRTIQPYNSSTARDTVGTSPVDPRPLTPSPSRQVGINEAGRGSSLESPVVLITLREESEELAEVEVKAKRQLIERQFDKIVLNVSNSPFAAGSNGKDLLKKAPGVQVDKDGNVTVNGKSVEVYIDGRPSYLSGDQLKAMLEGTDGSTIEKIEIISNPSTKYDAAGQGGIINIKTKRNMMQGLNGTLSASYGGMYYGDVEKWQNREMFSLNLNYRTEKTYTFATLTQFYVDQNIHVEVGSEALDTLTQTTTERYDESEYVCDFQYYMLKVGNDWFIDKKNTFGFIFQAPFMIMRQDVPAGRGWGYTKVGEDIIENSMSVLENPMRSQQYTANLNYTHVFNDSLERELTTNVDYNRYAGQQINSQQNTYYRAASGAHLPTISNGAAWRPHLLENNAFADSTRMGMVISTDQVVDIYSAKVDFQTRFWQTGMIEAGAKWAMSNTFNRMTTDSTINGVARETLHSDFDYSEQVAAVYISVAKQFGQKFNAKLGLRGEFTHSEGDWISADSTSMKNYFDVFPTAFFGYTPTDKWSMNVSYTRRIKRPSYYQLNPFRTYLDAHNYQEGNLELMPEFNNQVDLNFSYSQYVALAFNFAHTQDMLSAHMELLPNGNGRQKWVNFGTCTTHGGNLSLTELPLVPKFETGADGTRQMTGAWLALTLNGAYYYFINRSYDGTYLNRNHYGSASATLTAYLPQDWTLSVDGNYNTPLTIGYNKTDATWYMGAAVRKMWRKQGLVLNIQAQDLLRSVHYRSDSFGMAEGNSSYIYQNSRYQNVMVSLTWMFGQQQYMKRRKVGDMDESARIGGGGVGK
ncbi:MAG: TonB-dependent receptor domain-containing protein [Paludibacteraceae bacterium]